MWQYPCSTGIPMNHSGTVEQANPPETSLEVASYEGCEKTMLMLLCKMQAVANGYILLCSLTAHCATHTHTHTVRYFRDESRNF